MNRNNGAPPPPFPLPTAGAPAGLAQFQAAGRFGRPWLATRGANPLQSLPGASQLSTGGSYGTAARARNASCALVPHSQQQQEPGALGMRAYLPPWSQPSQPEFDNPVAFASGPDASQQPPALGSSGALAEPLFPHSQPSQVAARLLEELQGKSAPLAAPAPLPANDSAPLLRDILNKLESLEESHSKLAGAVAGVEDRLAAAANAASLTADAPSSDGQLDQVLNALETMKPGAVAMAQVLQFLEAAGQRPSTAEMATQTSPVAPVALPVPEILVIDDVGSPKVATGSSRPLGPRLVAAAFSGLKAVPLAGQKRVREAVSSDEESEDDLEVSPRVARRVQRHRQRQIRAGKAAQR